MTGNVLSTSAPAFAPHVVAERLRVDWNLMGTLRAVESERDQNFRLDTPDGARYFLRISNRAEKQEVVDFRIQAMAHVSRWDPGIPIQRIVPTLSGADRVLITDGEGVIHMAHMVSYLDGITLSEISSPRLALEPIGKMLARLGRALRGFFHPAAGHELLWDISDVTRLRPWLEQVTSMPHRDAVRRVLDRFEEFVAPQLPGLRAQVVHGDATADNVLVRRDDPAMVAGILDFGDMVHAPLINDVAIAMAHMVENDSDPLAGAEAVLRGYTTVTPLEEQELQMLQDLICARLAATVIITAWRGARAIGNRPADPRDDESVARRLTCFSAADPEDLLRRFRAACHAAPTSSLSAPDLMARRGRVLAPGYSLFYDQPLHIVRGDGVWLYDESGRAYLDAYNNVAHVGHCHPRVVEAISRQAATLNTNTRYLHEVILRYGERISAYLPPGLEVCTFVCTGSEANDLAFQMARCFRGHTGALVSDYSYHGNTELVSRLSSADFPIRGGKDFVRDFPPPDKYRGWLRDLDPALTRKHVAARADEVIAGLAAAGHQPAALLLDSMFVSEGIFTLTPEYLQTLCECVRAAGGLFIADEVQGGFGRSGEHFWSFAFGDVVPDIVTLGKPMGNGHPVALVVTTREIAGQFAKGPGYFNTFGGNPVACAAALAVLDVIEEDALQQNAKDVGLHLRTGLGELAKRHGCIGDIRGTGLCLGVEIVMDRESRQPAPAQAQRIKNRLRDLGVLIGTTSRHDNVLKIRPPLIFSRTNADHLRAALDKSLLDCGIESSPGQVG